MNTVWSFQHDTIWGGQRFRHAPCKCAVHAQMHVAFFAGGPCQCSYQKFVQEVHNEIHNIKKLSEALPSQIFQVVAKSNQRAKGQQRHILFLDQTTRACTLEAQRAQWRSRFSTLNATTSVLPRPLSKGTVHSLRNFYQPAVMEVWLLMTCRKCILITLATDRNCKTELSCSLECMAITSMWRAWLSSCSLMKGSSMPNLPQVQG